MIRPMAKRKRSEHYVNNKEFLAALIKYREDKEIALQKGLPKPPIPRYIGECFLKIANHLSFKPNFVNYMFKEDMISDGIENCVQYIHNFNPEKSQNPFAYFTQIINYAFLRRIQREKRQLEIKNKIIERSGYSEVFDDNNTLTDQTIPTTIASKMLFTLNFAIMMKVAIITDQHFGCRKNSKLFHDYFLKFYNDIFFPYLEEHGITTVIDMGDTFDSRKGVDFSSLAWAKDNYYDRLGIMGVHVHTIVGNHTAYYKNTNEVNAVDLLLREYHNVTVYSEATEVELDKLNVLLIPWINKENEETTFKLIKGSDLQGRDGAP